MTCDESIESVDSMIDKVLECYKEKDNTNKKVFQEYGKAFDAESIRINYYIIYT